MGNASFPPEREGEGEMIDRSLHGALGLPLEEGARGTGGKEAAGGRRRAICQSNDVLNF